MAFYYYCIKGKHSEPLNNTSCSTSHDLLGFPYVLQLPGEPCYCRLHSGGCVSAASTRCQLNVRGCLLCVSESKEFHCWKASSLEEKKWSLLYQSCGQAQILWHCYCKKRWSTPIKNSAVHSAIRCDYYLCSCLPAPMILLTAGICKTILALQFTDV